MWSNQTMCLKLRIKHIYIYIYLDFMSHQGETSFPV